jgi:hypothetical protein
MMPVKLRLVPVVGELAPIVGDGGGDGGGLGNGGGGGGVAFTSKDYELQFEEAMQEILRLRVCWRYSTSNEKKHCWKDVCRSREEEIAENRQKWQDERKLLVEEARRGREGGGGAMVFKL